MKKPIIIGAVLIFCSLVGCSQGTSEGTETNSTQTTTSTTAIAETTEQVVTEEEEEKLESTEEAEPNDIASETEATEEKVDGATIRKGKDSDEKIYDNPIVLIDDDYIRYELNSILIGYDDSGKAICSGMNFNLINKSEDKYVWMTFTDCYIGDNSVSLDTYIENMLAYPLYPGKRSDNCTIIGGTSTVNSIEEVENMLFTVQLTVNESADTVSSDDIIYDETVNIQEKINE